MIQCTRLFIRLTPGTLRPPLGATTINELRGGPETLLRWLESQLGLPTPDTHKANSITEYAAALDSVVDSAISASILTDRWATASELLSRRDELLLCGWDQSISPSLPEVVRDLACAAENRPFVFPCIADRLNRVLEALDSGQRLPVHECMLFDAHVAWPLRWRKVLERLTTAPANDVPPSARQGTALYAAQTVIRGGDIQPIDLDSSFCYVHTLSQTAAVEFVAATLATAPERLSTTVIVCEDDHLALQLDACLNRAGLPTMGASACPKAHPALQVLPLSLTLCWEPVDPQSLLDFLMLPVSPIPRRAAVALANALAEEPGLGSGRWQAALEDLYSQENDPDGKVRERLECWLFCDRALRGERITSRLVRSRCGDVARWASGRAIALATDEQSNLQLIYALQVAAGQASLLGELAESQGTHLSQPQLARLLEEVLADGVETVGFIEADGAPMRVRSLAEIVHPCRRLIWLGLATADAGACRWSAEQIETMQSKDVDLNDGSKALSALRSAEAQGLCHVQESLLAILLPQDIDRRWHPIWLAIRELLSDQQLENPLVLENLIESGDVTRLSPFTFPLQVTDIERHQGLRPHWNIPPHLIRERATVSASELQDRLACPLKWVLNYQAKLRPSSIARLPDDFRLKGNFCHSVLERVFGSGGELPSVDTAVTQVVDMFDRRLSLDAAPLAQPDKYLERQKLRKELANATRVLIATLASGGYRIKGIEVEVSGEAFGKSLIGWIDCVAERADGQEAIIDFKYGGRAKYQALIADGKAVQLATYAHGRFRSTEKYPAVAYLILSDGLLYTPSGSPIDGDTNRTLIDGIGITAVWDSFAVAIEKADGWLTGDYHVPARPLLDVEHWPDGASIVLETRLKANDVRAVCKYCDYTHICGITELL